MVNPRTKPAQPQKSVPRGRLVDQPKERYDEPKEVDFGRAAAYVPLINEARAKGKAGAIFATFGKEGVPAEPNDDDRRKLRRINATFAPITENDFFAVTEPAEGVVAIVTVDGKKYYIQT